jgi:hypothetical protein
MNTFESILVGMLLGVFLSVFLPIIIMRCVKAGTVGYLSARRQFQSLINKDSVH